MRLADVERHLREHGRTLHRQGAMWRSRHLVQKRAVWGVYFTAADF